MKKSYMHVHNKLPAKERNKTLQALEQQDWGDGNFPSHVVCRSHALRRKPLCGFTVEDLRLMIGQQMSLNYLLPLAIEQLQQDPLVSGDFFPGDLLDKVLRIDHRFWQIYPDLRQTITTIINSIDPLPENKELLANISIFQNHSS